MPIAARQEVPHQAESLVSEGRGTSHQGPSWPCPPSLDPHPPLQVRIWEIPEGGLKRNMTEALLELHGHSRRVGLVEWHPTTNNILFSAGYDYKVCSGQAAGWRGIGEEKGAF